MRSAAPTTPQPIDLPQWLAVLAQWTQPAHILMVGAGPGEVGLALHHTAAQLAVLEFDATARQALDRTQTTEPATARMRTHAALLAPADGTCAWHQFNHAAENGLLPLDALSATWPHLRTVRTEHHSAVSLDRWCAQHASQPDWIWLDCHPAAGILGGAEQALDHAQVVLVRVTTRPPGEPAASNTDAWALAPSRVDEVAQRLNPQRFQLAGWQAERNPDWATAVFVRHHASEQAQTRAALTAQLHAQAQAHMAAATLAAAETAALHAQLQAGAQALAKATADGTARDKAQQDALLTAQNLLRAEQNARAVETNELQTQLETQVKAHTEAMAQAAADAATQIRSLREQLKAAQARLHVEQSAGEKTKADLSAQVNALQQALTDRNQKAAHAMDVLHCEHEAMQQKLTAQVEAEKRQAETASAHIAELKASRIELVAKLQSATEECATLKLQASHSAKEQETQTATLLSVSTAQQAALVSELIAAKSEATSKLQQWAKEYNKLDSDIAGLSRRIGAIEASVFLVAAGLPDSMLEMYEAKVGLLRSIQLSGGASKEIDDLKNITMPKLNRWLSGEAPQIDSKSYWSHRYQKGQNSGAGSYGRLAIFKATTLNEFIEKNKIQTLIDLGCGDGNQLSMLVVPGYLGIDVSETVIDKNRDVHGSTGRRFMTLDEFKKSTEKAHLTVSMDVIYHLTEEDVYQDYMQLLFDSSEKFCIIYSCNEEAVASDAPHLRRRKFTNWVEANRSEWNLKQIVCNDYPFKDMQNPRETSISDFYIYKK